MAKNKGWTSFDDSPMHLPSGNTIANGPSPWGDENWTKVANDKNKSTYDFSGIENSTKKTNTSDEIHNNNTKAVTKETGFNPPIHSLSSSSSVVQPSETRPFGLDHQQSLNIQEVSQETQKTPSDYQDPWSITPEQRRYYTKQFTLMQEDVEGKIDGQTARSFFTKSKLPILELSHVWELSDMDQDGHLTLDEFCTAFHLVVARKNGYELPSKLPQALVPALIAMPAQAINKTKYADQWETFSERTSSSTTLANFDQNLDPTQETIHQPVALRMTPSQQQWMFDNDKSETIDEESTTSSPSALVKKQTNPYGYLKNEFSEESSAEEREKRSSMSSSSEIEDGADEKIFNTIFQKKEQSHSDSGMTSSASSSVATSERSMENHDKESEMSHSDWSSHLLQPRSISSDDSAASPLAAPTPPPRPQSYSVVSPLPKPRTSASRKNKPPESHDIDDIPVATVQTTQECPREAMESFADFTSFNEQNSVVEQEKNETARKHEVLKKTNSSDPSELRQDDVKETSALKKAPAKPPRTRMVNTEAITKREMSSSPALEGDIAPPPHQDNSRSKASVQSSIRELKSRNTQLSRMNSDLQQQLKRVMETRIGVEMEIHQMRPFSQ